MNKRSRTKLCMFCGKDESFGPMNREHFAFRGLWAGPRPNGTRTLPAHVSCNAEFAEDNEYVRDVLAIEAPADSHPEMRRLHEGTIRRKLQKMPGAMAAILKNSHLVSEFTPSGLYVGEKQTFDVDWPRIERVLSNVARGVLYTATGQPLPQDCVVRVISDYHRVPDDICRHIEYHVDHMCEWQSFGDDVFACRYVTTADPVTLRCLMCFCARRLFFAEAMPQRLIDEYVRSQQTASVPERPSSVN